MTPLGSLVVPDVNAISAGPAGSAASWPRIGSAPSRSSKSRPTTPTNGTSAARSGWYSSRPNRVAATNTFGLTAPRM